MSRSVYMYFWDTLYICLCFLPSLGNFQALFLWIPFQSPNSFSSPSGTLESFIIDSQVPESVHSFFSLFVHWCSTWVKSIHLSSSSLIPSSVISTLLLNLSSELLNLGYCIFQLYNFHLILFYNLFAEIFYFFLFVSREFVIDCSSIFVVVVQVFLCTVLKSLSDNYISSNIWLISVDSLLSFRLWFVWFVVLQSDLL